MVTRRTRRRSTRWWSWSWCVVSSYTYCFRIGLRWLVCIKFQRSDWAWLTDGLDRMNKRRETERDVWGYPIIPRELSYSGRQCWCGSSSVRVQWPPVCVVVAVTEKWERERGKEKNKENGTLRLGTTYLPRLLLVGLFRMGRDDATRTSVLCGG